VDSGLGGCQLAAGDRQRVVGVESAKGNLGAFLASEGFLLASGWDWGLRAGVNLGAPPANGCFLLASGWQSWGCPANGVKYTTGSWGRRGEFGSIACE